MNLESIVLIVAALVFLAVAVQGLFMPWRILAPLGARIETPSLANEIRANYGGMHAGIAGLLLAGAIRSDLAVPALALLAAFSGGLVVGRFVSAIADGAPNRFVRVFWGLEAVGALAAAALLYRNLG
jgi:hypothetical protein